MFEEAKIVFEEQADVVDAEFQHGNALDTETKSKSGPLLRIVTNRLKHGRIDHSRTKYFQPTCLRTDTAAFSAAHHTLDIDFGTGTGERKKTRPESYFRVFTKNLLQENIHDAF